MIYRVRASTLMRLRNFLGSTGLNDDSSSPGPHPPALPAVALLSLAVLAGCSSEPVWDSNDAAAIYDRYQDVGLDYFFDAPPADPTPEHPLYRGLKAKIDGCLDDAERHLEAATDGREHPCGVRGSVRPAGRHDGSREVYRVRD